MKQKAKPGYKLVEGQFGKFEEIPDTWDEPTKQGNVCKFINGYAYSKSEFRKSGYPIIRIQNLNGGKNYLYSDIPLPEKQFAEAGDLLFAWSATFGPYIWDGPKAAFHYHQWKVIPKENTDKKFLYYHLSRISSKIKQMGQSGLGMIHMTKDSMEKLQVNFPPKLEQKKIASILSNIDDLLDNCNLVIESTKKLKQGLVNQLFAEGINQSEFHIKKLKRIVKLSSGEFLPQSKQIAGDVPVFGGNGIMGHHNASLTTYPTIIIGRVGAYCGSVHFTTENSWITDNAIFIKKFSDEIEPEFLYRYLLEMKIILMAEVSAQPKITQGILNNIKIKFPKDKQVQQRIVEIIGNIDLKIQNKENYKSQYAIIKKDLIKKLLTGKIRVKV